MAERGAGLRDYVVTNAKGRGWAELWPLVMQARSELLSELLDVSEERATRQPASGEGEEAWSMFQVMQHVLTYTRNVSAIIEATAKGEQVFKDPPGAIHGVAETSWRGLQDALVEASAELANLHSRLPAEPNLRTTVSHAVFGPFNCREWFVFLSWHDASHQRQIASLKEQFAS